MLEKIIVGLIGTGITTIITAYIRSLQKKIEELENRDIPKPVIPPTNGDNADLNSLEIQILDPKDGETITQEGSYPIKGIIKNIPKGMRLNNLSKELGLYVLDTSDDKKFWPQDDIEKDIDSNVQNGVKFHSSHFVESSRDVLIVLAGEKAQGAMAFYEECHREKIFEKADRTWLPIPKKKIGSDIKVLAKVHINFDPK